MQPIYATEPILTLAITRQNRKCVFLVGPTPRSADVPSWRPEALRELEAQEFDGYVLIPETRDGVWKHDYLDQVEWEWEGLNVSQAILAWVPRDLETMPGFTTNVEFGHHVGRGLFYGRPEGAPKTRYLDHLYRKTTSRKPHDNLKDLVAEIVAHFAH